MPESGGRPGFVTSGLVRHAPERENATLSLGEPGAGLLLFAGDRVVLRVGAPMSVLLDPDGAPPAAALCVFLGRVGDRPIFAVAVDPETDAYPEPAFQVRDLRAVALEGLVPDRELGLLATAKSILSWHRRHGFCANCGAPTAIAAAGFRRDCPSCGAHHFPRTDPVAIMLVRRGERCLIGRGAHFPGTMYSCLAGFVEPGETIEDAVRRETFEETGIRVGAVRYHSSQPWPFPSSLMIGCVGEALSEAIALDPAELADARWVTRDELRLMFEERHPEGLTAPKPLAIAHWLLRDFLDGRA